MVFVDEATLAGTLTLDRLTGLARIAEERTERIAARLAAETEDPEQKALLHMEWGGDFGSPHETYLTTQFEKPVFVHHYPTAVKAFYMEPESDRRPSIRSCIGVRSWTSSMTMCP